MQTLSTTTDGVATIDDPDCGFARVAPGLHVCTDRDGAPVTADKTCFAWARHQLRSARQCRTCHGEPTWTTSRCAVCDGSGVELDSAANWTPAPAGADTCPACTRAVYRIHRLADRPSSARWAEPVYEATDLTFRHSADGTVAVTSDGAVSCAVAS